MAMKNIKAEAMREAKMKPKAEAKNDAKEKAKMGAKGFMKHEKAETKAMKGKKK